MSKLFAALLLVLASQSAMTAVWYLVETTKNAFFFVDKSSLNRSGTKVSLWTWVMENTRPHQQNYSQSLAINVVPKSIA